jgi:hypothetical protein
MPSTTEQDGMSSFLVNIRLTGHYKNIVDERQFLTSTSNVYCLYFRLDR